MPCGVEIDQFIDRRDVKRTLSLHAFDGSPYYLGVFLVGAYQEILGDLHALVNSAIAAFEALYAESPATPNSATIVVTLMIAPLPRATIFGAIAAVSRNGLDVHGE